MADLNNNGIPDDQEVPVVTAPVLIGINCDAKVNAQNLTEFKIGSVVVTGLDGLATEEFDSFAFSVKKNHE